MPYKIQQLGLGGILDQAITLVKNHFGLLFQIMLMTWIPVMVISEGVKIAAGVPQPPASINLQDWVRYSQEVERFSGLVNGLNLVTGVGILIANAAVIYSVAQLYLGKPISAGAAVQKALGKLWPLIWTVFVMTLAIMGGLLLCLVPGILFALWFGLSQHVVVLESLSGSKALGRSKKLVQPYLGTFFILGLLVGIIALMVVGGATLIPQQYLQLAVALLLNAITTIFSTAVFVVFYFSCRCGVDNFDLEHLAAAVGESAPPALEPEAI